MNDDFQAILKLSYRSNTQVLLIIRWDYFIINQVKLVFMVAFWNKLGPFVNEIDR